MFLAHLVGLLFFGVPALIALTNGWIMLKDSLGSKRWPPVKGRVVEIKFAKEERSLDNTPVRRRTKTVYRPVVKYRYNVKGLTYSGENEYPDQEFDCFDHIGEAKHHIREWPLHKKIDVYVNPEDYSQSCLKTGLTILPIMILIFGTGAAIMAIIQFFALIHSIMT
jgi:hypothetical protein